MSQKIEALILDSTQNSPRVEFNPAIKKFEIAGESRPENAKKFYEPLIGWVEAYGKFLVENKAAVKSPEKFELDLKLDYFNSSSSSFLLTFLGAVKDISKRGIDVKVNWYYDRHDLDMKETGEEFTRILNFPFKLIPYEAISN